MRRYLGEPAIPGDDSGVNVKHLFGEHLRQRDWDDDYVARGSNEDYDAIEAVAAKMQRTKTLHRPVMFVISDGQPCGSGRNGKDAIESTTAVVANLRAEGWRVFSFGLGEDHASPHIYGKSWIEQVSMESKLPTHLRNLIVRCSRRHS